MVSKNVIIIRKILLFMVLISTHYVKSCDCKTPKTLKAIQQTEILQSDYIFVGEVMSFDFNTNTFEIRVIESFKGSFNEETIVGHFDAYCGPNINSKGRWIIYSHKGSNEEIIINACGLTRSFIEPESNIMASDAPLPPPANHIETNDETNNDLMERKIKAKVDLQKEIEILRTKDFK